MASPSASIWAVVSALTGNAFVTVIKLIAFLLSGSGAMLSETIHSAADTGNQALLYLGLKRAGRKADDRFQYGYGGERFVFGMLSAAGIFFVGCGVTIYHGISGLLHPHHPELTWVTFAVLGVAFVIEGSVLLFAARVIVRDKGDEPFFRYVRERADPAVVAILLEDGAAVLGLLVASGGIVLTYYTGDPMWDSIGSLVVGAILGYVALYLVRQNRGLLLGQAVPEGIEERFTEIVARQPSVSAVHDVKTRQLTPEDYQFKAEILFHEEYLARHIDRCLPRDGAALQGARREATLRRIAAAATDVIATEIKAIERAVLAEIPQARHIDLEVAHPPADYWDEKDDEDEAGDDGSG